MKTLFTYVIQMEPLVNGGVAEDEEVIACSEGLARRYSAPIVKIAALATPAASNWRQYIDQHGELRNFKKMTSELTELSPDIGVYIVAHGGNGVVAGLRGNHVGELLKELGFHQIRKIAIVACFTANEKSITPDQSFFGLICNALWPMTPIVAAYSGFVTVGDPGNKTITAKSVGAKHVSNRSSTNITPDQFEQMKQRAQKAIRGSQNRPVLAKLNPEIKQKLKHAFKATGQNSIAPVPLDDWHDA
jgi:hypothetical protein